MDRKEREGLSTHLVSLYVVRRWNVRIGSVTGYLRMLIIPEV